MAQTKFVEVFDLDTEMLECPLPEVGSYRGLLWSIRSGVLKRARAERDTAEKEVLLGPPELEGKPVCPLTKEYFVVRVRSEGRSILLLFDWTNLYNIAFYVDDKQDAKNRCWYISQGVHRSALPPQEQFSYVDVMGEGIFRMFTKESYADLGELNIMLGKDAINGYVKRLFTIRSSMTKVGGKLVIGSALKEELRSGPLTFGPVAISEASRFADFKTFMLESIYLSVRVPLRFSYFFTDWSILSVKVKKGKGFELATLTCTFTLTAEQVVRKMAILCSRVVRETEE